MPNWIAFGILAVVLVAAAIDDYRTGKVHNVLAYPAIAIGLLFWAIHGFVTGGGAGLRAELIQSLIAFAAGFIPFAIIFNLGGLGGGDVKIMGAVGAISAKPLCVLGTAFYAFFFAAIIGIVVMIRHRIVRRTLRRLLGAALLFPTGAKPDIPDDSPRIPFVVSICMGALLAGAEHLLGVSLPWGGA